MDNISHKFVYDDVFRGPAAKFGLPTLAPRNDDYSEIFHSSHRSLSIPLLHLRHHSNLFLHFDYDEIFGGASTDEDLVGYDHSWSPASLSDGSDKSLDADALNNKPSQSNIGILFTHLTNFTSLPGYTFTPDENCSVSVFTKEYDAGLTEENQHAKSSEIPLHSGFNAQTTDSNFLDKHANSTSKPFITVSDISLRTKPSPLPPPSRPPPALLVNKGDSGRSDFKLKASTSYGFQRVSDDSASLSSDVEVDANLSPVSRETRNKNVEVKHETTKEPIGRKDIHSRSAMLVEEKTNKTARVRSSIKDEKMSEPHIKETVVSVPAIEDRIESVRGTEDISGSQGSRPSADNSAGTMAWREATEYFEVIEKDVSQEAFDMVKDYDTSKQRMNRDANRHLRSTESDTFNQQEDRQKLKLSKEALGLEEKRMQPEMTCEQKEIPNTKLSDQKGFQEKVIPNKLASLCNLDEMVPQHIQQFPESERLQADHTVTVEVHPEAKSNLSEVDAKSNVKAPPKGMDIEKRFIDAQLTKQNSGRYRQTIPRKECQRRLEDVEGAETRDKQLTCEGEKYKERLMEDGKQLKSELTYKDSLQQDKDEKDHKLIREREVTKERNEDASEAEDNGSRFRRAATDAGDKFEVSETNVHMNLIRAAGVQEDLSGHAEEIEPIERNECEREVERDMDCKALDEEDQLKEFDGVCNLDETTATKVSGKQNNEGKSKDEGIGQLNTEPKNSIYETGAEGDNTLFKGQSNEFSKNKNDLLGAITHSATNNNIDSSFLSKQTTDSNICGSGRGVSSVMVNKLSSELACNHEPEKIMSTKNEQGPLMKNTHCISKRVDLRDSFIPCHIRESTVNGKKVEDASSVLKHSDDTLYSIKNATSQKIERKDHNIKENLAANDQKVGERIRREIELENEHIRKIEEEKEREREREKDRMAVDKAALEARERSYAEARERAAVERATTEVRQRAMVGARERLEKASMETKLRAERAAVERATAEARQRAAESMAQKAASEAHDRVERPFPDRFPASFRYADSQQSSLSYDFHLRSTGISNNLRYPYSCAHDGADGESPQRCKARLERYRRTAERAASALAEKNRRDLLAQREREERNKVAEALDAEIKRWSSGKEGNLRALLSTLQYILGSDSGWQPVPLTEVITTAAVRRAYRKATLCVHPDKLQQRGATIQQKYICEKVFDLLKEAWNKFNSEER